MDNFHQGTDFFKTHGLEKQEEGDALFNKPFVSYFVTNTHHSKYVLWPDGKLKTH